jgi:AraC family transcriptional regulator, transcriptional activator of pobA
MTERITWINQPVPTAEPLTRAASIPSFYLYGEPHRIAAEGFVHVETLDDRSRPTEWTIRAHSHRELNHIFFIAEGGGDMRTEERLVSFTAPCLLIVPSTIVHGFQWHAESAGSVITLANSYLIELVRRDADVQALFRKPVSIPVTFEESKLIKARVVDLMREFSWASVGHRTAVDAALLPIILLTLRTVGLDKGEDKRKPGHYANIVARFRERVEVRFRLRESVEQHAKALGVSNTALRVACSRIAGIAPALILDERALLEAKRALLYSDLSVSEIAYSLGFNDAAYFSRFFVRHVSLSPRAFRENRN